MKTRQRKQRGVLNIAELPPQHIQRSKPLRRAEILRAHLKLKQLIDQEKFEDARLLFTELIRTSRYNLHNFWKIGIQIIGRTSPNQLTDYLRAVYINAPPYLSLVTFSAYIDQLMIDKKWSKTIEEIDLLFARPQYHHPILLRKKAVCSYQNWVQAKQSLPDEDEIQDEYDPAVIRYERCLKIAAKNLEEAYKVYDFDVELVSFIYSFLKATEDEGKAKDIVLRSLNAFEKRPDFYLLKYLLEVNEGNNYFDKTQFILPLYEHNPLYDSVHGLKDFVGAFCQKLASQEKKAEDQDTSERLFSLFISRVGYGIVERWFLKSLVQFVLKYATSQKIYDLYRTKNLFYLLNSTYILQKTNKPDSVVRWTKRMQETFQSYESEHAIISSVESQDEPSKLEISTQQQPLRNESSQSHQSDELKLETIVDDELVGKEEANDEAYKSTQYIPFLDDITLLDQYFHNPLLNI